MARFGRVLLVLSCLTLAHCGKGAGPGVHHGSAPLDPGRASKDIGAVGSTGLLPPFAEENHEELDLGIFGTVRLQEKARTNRGKDAQTRNRAVAGFSSAPWATLTSRSTASSRTIRQ